MPDRARSTSTFRLTLSVSSAQGWAWRRPPTDVGRLEEQWADFKQLFTEAGSPPPNHQLSECPALPPIAYQIKVVIIDPFFPVHGGHQRRRAENGSPLGSEDLSP
jgi:hypothetical protein